MRVQVATSSGDLSSDTEFALDDLYAGLSDIQAVAEGLNRRLLAVENARKSETSGASARLVMLDVLSVVASGPAGATAAVQMVSVKDFIPASAQAVILGLNLFLANGSADSQSILIRASMAYPWIVGAVISSGITLNPTLGLSVQAVTQLSAGGTFDIKVDATGGGGAWSIVLLGYWN